MDKTPRSSSTSQQEGTSIWSNGQPAQVVGLGRGMGRGRGRGVILFSDTQQTTGIFAETQPPTVEQTETSQKPETRSASDRSSSSNNIGPPLSSRSDVGQVHANLKRTKRLNPETETSTKSSNHDEDFDFDQLEVVSSVPREDFPVNRAHVPRLSSSYFCRGANRRARPAEAGGEMSEILLEPVLARRDNCGLPEIPCKVILRGIDVYHPYQDINAFPLLELVRKALAKQRIDAINELQRVAWPHVLKGRHCFIVGGVSDRQGKTLSYLVPIAAKALKDADIMKSRSEIGPVGIILCSGKQSGDKIVGHLESLIGEQGLTFYHGLRSDSSFKRKLSKNPDFLVCSPDFLLFIKDKSPDLFGFDRLRYMIVDDCHILHEEHQASLRSVLELFSHSLDKTNARKCPIQFVFCGTEWNDMIREEHCEESSSFNDPVLIISSFPQALVYGNIKLQLLLANEDEKPNRVAEIIKNGVSKDFVIVCQERDMAAKIGTCLYRAKGISCICFDEDDDYTIQEQYAKLHETWSNRPAEQSTVLITTDDDLRELKLKDVSNMINFELPKRKQDAFGERHICMWNFFPDLNSVRPRPHQELRSYVLLSPDDPELVKVVSFMKTLNADVPQDLQEVVEMNTENSLKSAELCDGIRIKGKCNAEDKPKCQRIRRHFFTKEELEAESTIPKFVNGRVDLKILETKHLNEYTARVLNFYQVKNGSKLNNLSYEEVLSRWHSDLATFYELESNRKPLPNPRDSLGRLCAIKYIDDYGKEFYTRAKTDMVLKETNPRLRLFCVDIGGHKALSPDLVYQLPPEFETLPLLITRVIIAGLKPLQGEEEFRSNWKGQGENTIDVVKKTLTGAVALAINDVIWVHSLMEWEKTTTGDWVNKLDLRREFIRKRRVAESNPDHLRTLYKLCEDKGFSCRMYEALESVAEEFQTIDDNYDWAFIKTSSPDKCSLTKSWSTCIVSPDQIYLVQMEFEDQLDTLIAELNDEIDSLIQDKYADYKNQFLTHYEVGLCVAAKDVDGRWARAIITNRVNDATDGISFDVFFVDHGDRGTSLTQKEIFPLPKTFVRRLPFQVVAVRLDHIEPPETKETTNSNGNSREWEALATQFLQDVLIKDGVASVVDIVATSKVVVKSESDPMCAYYNAFVLPPPAVLESQQSQADQASEMGEMLVSKQLAMRKPDTWEVWESTKSAMLKMLNEAVDQAHAAASDSSDYEIEADSEDENESEHGFTSYFGNDNNFLNTMLEGMGLKIPSDAHGTEPPALGDRHTANGGVSDQDPRPYISPVEVDASVVPGAKVPTVLWRQTKTHLTIQICLVDVRSHSLTLGEDCRTIAFQSIDPEGYAFNIKLFAKVNSCLEETPGGQSLLVKLEKISHGKWENIIATKSPRWLRPDLVDVSDSEHSEDEEPDEGPNRAYSKINSAEQETNTARKQKSKPEDCHVFADLEQDFGYQGGRPDSDSQDSISSDEDITMG